MTEAEELAAVASLMRRLLTEPDDDRNIDALREVWKAPPFIAMTLTAALAGMTRDLLARLWPDDNDPDRVEWIAKCSDVVEYHDS